MDKLTTARDELLLAIADMQAQMVQRLYDGEPTRLLKARREFRQQLVDAQRETHEPVELGGITQ